MFQVCVNGLLSLDHIYISYTPESFPLPSGVGMIAPFWADADLRKGGNIWSRETNDSEILVHVSAKSKRSRSLVATVLCLRYCILVTT